MDFTNLGAGISSLEQNMTRKLNKTFYKRQAKDLLIHAHHYCNRVGLI